LRGVVFLDKIFCASGLWSAVFFCCRFFLKCQLSRNWKAGGHHFFISTRKNNVIACDFEIYPIGQDFTRKLKKLYITSVKMLSSLVQSKHNLPQQEVPKID